MKRGKSRPRKETIAVVGLGYVGLPLAVLAAKKEYKTLGIDLQQPKIQQLTKRFSTVKDERLEKMLSELPKGSIEFASNFSRIGQATIVIICVPTPVDASHMPDLTPVKAASKAIADKLKKGQLIVLESTVNPGVSEEIVQPILEKTSGMKCGTDFHLAHCPERINPGDKKWHVGNIPRVVGSTDPEGLRRAHAFYSSIIGAEIIPMGSIKEAEAVKIVENSFRDINIAFVNELAMSFSKLGINVMNVIKGASSKPFAFMPHYPSCGVGGHCIPVDPYYLIEYAHKQGFHHEFLSLARRINNDMPEFTVSMLREALNELKMSLNGSVITVLGIAYKGNIEDYRESPALEIIKLLKRTGAEVRTYDPHVPSKSSAKSLKDALEGANAVVVATAHNEFKALSPKELLEHGIAAVVDGCNCLPKARFIEAGLVYRGIGI